MSSDQPWDIDYPRALLYGLVIVLVLTVVFAASTSGAAFGVYNSRWDGASTLRTQADATETELHIVRNTTTYTSTIANGSVAFVLSPETSYTTRDVTRLRTFVQRGGTLVVAADAVTATGGNRLLTEIGATPRFGNATLRDERHNYRSPAMPVAQHVTNHTLTTGLDSLTLNYGTAVQPGNATVLVTSSGYAYLDRDGSESATQNESLTEYPVLVTEDIGNGSVVTVSDPSVFLNTMLERPGNQQLLQNLLDTHQRVLLDYSHTNQLPPLVVALLTIRQSTLLQVVLSLCGLLLISGWGRGSFAGLPQAVRAWWTAEEYDTSDITADAADINAYLREQHPDWDADRIDRIAESIATTRDQEEQIEESTS